jgi:hypothetical protein
MTLLRYAPNNASERTMTIPSTPASNRFGDPYAA